MAAKIPGIGSQFVGLAGSTESARLEMEAIQQSFSDQAAEAWEGVKGNSALAQSIDAGRGVLQVMKGELAAVTIATHRSPGRVASSACTAVPFASSAHGTHGSRAAHPSMRSQGATRGTGPRPGTAGQSEARALAPRW